jgi:hypothetical protein
MLSENGFREELQIELIGSRIKITQLEDQIKKQNQLVLKQASTIAYLQKDLRCAPGGYNDKITK